MGGVSAGCVVGTVLAWRRLDTLPQWLQAGVRGYMALDDRSAASVPGTTPLSKHVAYKLDYWSAPPHFCHAPHAWPPMRLLAAVLLRACTAVYAFGLHSSSVGMKMQAIEQCRILCLNAWSVHDIPCCTNRFSRNPWAKALSLIYVTLALIYIGGLGMYAVSGQPLHEAFWEVQIQLSLTDPMMHLMSFV